MDVGAIPSSGDYSAEYYLTSNGSRLVLQTGAFGCSDGTRRAIVVNGNGGAWVGCWSEDGEKITIIWEDDDKLVIPKQAIDHRGPTAPAAAPRTGDISS